MLHIAAREAIGAPFRHQGRSVSTGMDCAGLLIYSAEKAGFKGAIKDFPMYGQIPDPRMLDYAVSQCQLEQVTLFNIQPGDIVRLIVNGLPVHFAIYTDKDTLIHAVSSRSKVCEHRFDSNFKRNVYAVYRITSQKD